MERSKVDIYFLITLCTAGINVLKKHLYLRKQSVFRQLNIQDGPKRNRWEASFCDADY